MPPRSKFDIELAYGELQEKSVRDLLMRGPDRLTVEVKSDRRTHETGNIFVELSELGRPSGLMASKADWIVYDIAGLHDLAGKPTVLLWYERESLIARLRKAGLTQVPAGDGKRVRGLKVPVLASLGIGEAT